MRTEPDRKTAAGKARISSNVKGVGDTASNGTPTQNMGSPASKTLLKSDELSISKTTDDSAGNATTQQAAATDDMMATVDQTNTTPDVNEDVRSIIDHQYPSEGGRFVDGTTESTLAFRETVAGADALWQLGTVNQTAENQKFADAGSTPTPGNTYVITTGGNAISGNALPGVGNTETGSALGSKITSSPVAQPAASQAQQWAVVDAGQGDGSYWLVNRSDGLCLTQSGPLNNLVVTVDVCADDTTRRWRTFQIGSLFGITTDRFSNNYVGSSGGQDNPGTIVAGIFQSWSFRAMTGAPGGSVPTWSVPRTGGYTAGHITAAYDMSVGDLDGVIGSDGLYHDEAVVAYTDSNDHWALRVVDYNANTSHLLVTAPDPSLSFGKNGFYNSTGPWYQGSLVAKVGDFDGDGRNEILTGYQDSAGSLTLTFWRYDSNSAGKRSLDLVSSCVGCAGQPFPKAGGQQQSLITGSSDTAVGDFDGDGRTDLAVGYPTSPKGNIDDTQQSPTLGVVTFGSDLLVRSVEVSYIPLAKGTSLPHTTNGDPTRTSSGIRLEAGIFSMDPSAGFGYQRRELAMSWVTSTKRQTRYLGGDNDDYDAYQRQVQMQFFSVNDTSCSPSSEFTVCTSIVPMTDQQPNPATLFPADADKDQTIVKGGQPEPDVPPLAMEAGAYGGSGPDDPPVWGVWFLQWHQAKKNYDQSFNVPYEIATSIVVPWAGADTPDGVVFHDSYIANATSSPMAFTVTAYDRAGDSVYLGAPVLFDVDNSKNLDMLAAAPPKHADYLTGAAMKNISYSNDYKLSTTSKTNTEWSTAVTNENTYSYGGSTADSAKATLAAGLGPFDAKSSASLSETFNKAWTGTNQTSVDFTGSKTLTVTSAAVDDDILKMSVHDYQVYRYPVLGKLAGKPTCSNNAGCNPYYEVTIPGSTTWLNEAGLADSDYQPSWQNGNALSYPAIDPTSGAVPLPDAGPYSYLDESGATQTSTTPLYNGANDLGGNTNTVDLDLDTSLGAGSTITSGHNWSSDTELNLSASVSVGVPDESGATFDLSSTDGVQLSKTFSNSTVTSSKTSTGTEFQLSIPEVSTDDGYRVGTAVYYSAAGVPKVVHGVDLTSSRSGTFFSQNYAAQSDVALNLPSSTVVEYDNADNPTVPVLANGPARQLIRGFQTLQVDPNGPLSVVGSPFSSNPLAGQRMQFQVQVHNYSLMAMPSATTAHFYAVPVNQALEVTGPKVELGTTPVPALGPQATEAITSPDWTAPFLSDLQTYRIFVVLNEDGNDMHEVHPLNSTACPSSAVEDGAALYDLTSTTATAADPTGCGQNNQGYGLVSISPYSIAAERGTPSKPAKVSLDGGGLLDGVKSHRKLDTSSAVPQVPLNANLTALVYAKAERHSVDSQPVLVYDGDPDKGKLIYSGRLPGVSPTSGGSMTFPWKPTSPGLHELHTVILGSSTTGEDDEQIMRVWVDSKPRARAFTVTATADAAQVEPGGTTTISGSVTPKLTEPNDRNVALQRQGVTGWSDVAEIDTDADGAYTFSVPQPDEGTFIYRVKKLPADGRSVAYSPPLKVAVVRGFAVTAKASPKTIRLGKKATISGKVTPTVAARRDRTVQLQTTSGGTWKKVDSATTTASGKYHFTVKPKHKGTYKYRVVKTPADSRPSATSPTVKITVKRR